MSLGSGMSLELLSATPTQKFSHQVLIVTHVDVNMNLSRRWQMSNNLKQIQITKMLALKWNVKCHSMKQSDIVWEGGKH
jgi:hypothetical protein